MIWVWVLLIAIAVFLVVSLAWRFGSRGRSIPCPAWFAWALDVGKEDKPFGRGRVMEELALEPGMRVLDVGCGPGILTVPAARAVGTEGKVVALDIQQGMLDRLAKRVERAGLTNVEAICAGAGEGKVLENRFDRAILSLTLGEITDREGALREIHDALKPGGYVVVAEMFGDPHYQFKSKLLEISGKVGLQPGKVTGGFWRYTMRLYRSKSG